MEPQHHTDPAQPSGANVNALVESLPVALVEKMANVSSLLMQEATKETVLRALTESQLTRIFLSDVGGQGFLALCEVMTPSAGNGTAKVTHVEVTTRVGRMADRHVASCIVWTKRATPANIDEEVTESPTSAGHTKVVLPSRDPFSDLHVQTLSVEGALDELQRSLVQLYEPLCHPQRDAAVRSTIQELASVIKSRDSIMADFVIQRYVHSELLAVCAAHPEADVRQLVEALGPKAQDQSFINDVRQVRAKAVPILETDIHAHDVASYREEILYWQKMLEWLEDANQQVQCREWKLVLKILDRRVDHSAESQLALKIATARDYLRILQGIPVADIIPAKDEQDTTLIARRISEHTSRIGKYPVRRMLTLLQLITDELVDKLVKFAASKPLFSMRPTEEALPYLRMLRGRLNEVHQLYLAQYQIFSQTHPQHRYMRCALERVLRLQEFFDEHFSLYDSVKRVFTGDDNARFVGALEHLHSHFIAAVTDVLWDLSERGTSSFLEALETYQKGVQHAEEEIALLVKSMISGAPNTKEMYRLHAQFRHVKRPKIQSVIGMFRVPLLEMIDAGIKDAQDKFLDNVAAQRIVRVNIAKGLSPLAARIVWEHSLEQTFSQLLAKRDSLSDLGWNQLLSLQTVDRKWRLNDALAQYIGVTVADLVRSESQTIFAKDSDVGGTALALGYLELMYPEDQVEIQKNLRVRAAHVFLRQADQQALSMAKARLRNIPNLAMMHDDGKEREHTKDARHARHTIVRSINDGLRKWWAEVSNAIGTLVPANARDGGVALPSRVYIVEHAANAKKQLAISIPEIFHTWQTDFSYLSALKILGGSVVRDSNENGGKEIPVDVFFNSNQTSLGLASLLRALVRELNVIMENDHDQTIITLLQAEYREVYTAIKDCENVTWADHMVLQQHALRFSKELSALSLAAENVRRVIGGATNHLQVLSEEICNPQEIRHHVHEIRLCMKNLSLKTANAHMWIRRVAPKLERALVHQLEEALKEWTAEYKSLTDERFMQETAETVGFRLKPLRVKMCVRQRKVRLETWAPQWRNHWYANLNKAVSWLSDIPTLESLRTVASSGVGADVTPTMRSTYHHLIDKLPENVLRDAMNEIEASIAKAIEIEREWHKHEELLNQDLSKTEQELGDDLMKWISKMHENREFAVTQMDMTRPTSLLGGIVTLAKEAQREFANEFEKVRVSVNSKACNKAMNRCDATLKAINTARNEIEHVSGKSDKTEDERALEFLCSLPKYSKILRAVEDDLKILTETEQELKRQNYVFPDSWVPISRMQGVFRVLKELVDSKSKTVEDRRDHLVSSLSDTVARVEYNISETDRKVRAADLDSTKRTPAQSLEEVNKYLADVQRLHEQANMTASSQAILCLDLFNSPKLDALLADLKTLQTTWENLLNIHKQLTELGARPFFDENPRKVQNDLVALEGLMSSFPEVTRGLHIYRDMASRLAKLKSYFKIHQDLRSDAMTCMSKPTMTASSQAILCLDVFNSPKLDALLADLKTLQTTWEHLLNIHKQLTELGARPFFDENPRKVQNDLVALEGLMSSFPEVTRGLHIYRDMASRLAKLKSYFKIHQDLRSDAMTLDRSRTHWTSLKTQLRQNSWILDSLTLQDFWSSNPQANAKIYQAVLEIAQGERRLAIQLQQISTYWDSHTLETSFYQNKVALVKGWDAIFERLGEDLNSLTAMKLSPFYKSRDISTPASDWDKKLNSVRQVLDVLLDVQRRWVYLDGIFSGSVEIRHQLPNESSQFDRTSRDFIGLMPKSKQGPLTAVKFVEDERILPTLEKIALQLNQIQRALGEYLDTQRSRFPRFYFVGDDDLLEVIGSGKDPLQVSKHLKKMFAGINAVQVESSTSSKILSITSAEGETIALNSLVDPHEKAVYEWLSALEEQTKLTLRAAVVDALKDPNASSNVVEWIGKYPSQIVALVAQVLWVASVEDAFNANTAAASTNSITSVLTSMVNLLEKLAADVMSPALGASHRQKAEQVITVAVYQRDSCRSLNTSNTRSATDFEWLRRMRPYYTAKNNTVACRMADAEFDYGYEYLGMQERLVQTALTDKCFLTLTQALHTRLGGSPSGPAGTGKTETVKALGCQLGRFVLVFNCDETFDFKSMGRIFVGLCQVGAWGCFDEFNRLEERILSAVSQQIQSIQDGLRLNHSNVHLDGKKVTVHNNAGIFITMNPGYAGRSNLPDNLKQLFRSVAMITPDRENIAEVMLFAQGFKTAEVLSRKVVPLFRLCRDQLSNQSHYDFGLRALKSVLVSAGGLKRGSVSRGQSDLSVEDEQRLLMQSLTETIVPKLVADDVSLFYPLIGDVFPGLTPIEEPLDRLKDAIHRVAASHGYTASADWVAKLLQLYKITHVNHGIMLVGESGTGKSAAWMTLLRALAEVDDIDGHSYVMDPKAVSKAELYGVLDPTTREWRDGIFTATLRKIVDNVKGDDQHKKRHWIIFDGDVDPEWVENLNSLLDDNRLFTLPNGERLTLPSNVRIMFEVQNLRFATPATVSRCGMVWFSADLISARQLLDFHLHMLNHRPFTVPDIPSLGVVERRSLVEARQEKRKDEAESHEFGEDDEKLLQTQRTLVAVAEDAFKAGGLVERSLHIFVTKYASSGIMDFNLQQSLRSVINLFAQSAFMLRQHTSELSPTALKSFADKRALFACLWGFGSTLSIAKRTEFAADLPAVDHLPSGSQLLDVEVDMDGNWSEWRKRVVRTEIQPDKVGTNDIVIPTVDTTRHEDIISSWLRSGMPVVLCGPPGSGKTMSLTAVLRASSQYEAVFLNFSSATSPETILKTLEQYCVIKNTLRGFVMSPTAIGKRLIVFCDEINLPNLDKYGTQRVVQFMRQLTEQQGFYRAKDNAWVHIEHVQFVGACNPPTDPGRVPMTHRFLRWAPVIFVDFPSFESLQSIYETYCRAMFYKNIKMRAVSPNLSKAMVAFFKASQERFTAEIQRHYVYSPRELSRWSRAIYEGLLTLDDVDQKNVSVEDVVRLAVHEGLRIFRDRLVTEEEGKWTDTAIDCAFFDNFQGLPTYTLQRPILFSTIFTRAYASVEREELRTKLRERIREFRDEEIDVELVVFDSVVDHVVRIDRVLRQPLGHMLLVGSSGVGKTVLSRFVAWLNHLSVFQVKAHRGYTLLDFEEDLRNVMRRSGCKREKICFIFDESNIMDSNFLEYMNALLASGEVPGLFDGDAWTKLLQSIREGISSSGSTDFVDTSSEQEMYRWFIRNVQTYLHVVFTMNPSSPDFQNRSATSPALFNRCTIDWFGDWSSETTFHVAKELCARVDVMFAGNGDKNFDEAQHSLAECINKMHEAVTTINLDLRQRNTNAGTFITPRHFLDFIRHFQNLFREKREAVEDQQRHLNSGLSKLRETSLVVDEQQRALEEKEVVLADLGRKAQDMLEKIISETDKAKRGKQEATEMKSFLEKESVRITQERAKVENELAEAEPALKDAETALNTIKPENLRELRAYATPPPMVKKVLEAVVLLLGEKRADDWEVIKGYTRRDDFIAQIKAFRPANIADDARDKIKKRYLSDDNFTYENAQRASRAAGPLHKWVTAQVRFSDIFASVGPLRAEIDRLAEQYEQKLKGLQQAEVDIQANEASIERLKATYQQTTEENSRIKMEISAVASRCGRAKALMGNLLAEKHRWEEQSASFHQQTKCVMGDCLLAGAFLAYIGYFDEHSRRNLIVPEWQDIVDCSSIAFRREMSVVEYLSLPEKRLLWSANRLPQDNLCIENAIIMERFQRYPLIVDPSGQAVEFLLKYLQPKKIAKTSFVEKGFMKQLENAVRFGYPILVQDVENIDPVLNPLLNQEVRRVGGRSLVRLGAQDVDMSPSFSLYLSTRDETFQFSPDVCGRVTMVNFTATLSSLEAQCLHHVMLHERPDIDEKRSDLMKLQGEYRARLRTLEQDLLTAISVAEGNILENEQLIKTLETLKTESFEIEAKFRQSEDSFQEISVVEAKYTPLAKAASKLFFSLAALRELDETYLFSLRFFLRLLESALSALPDATDRDTRIPVIARQLFAVAHQRVTRSAFGNHHMAIALRLAQLRCTINDSVGTQLTKADWDVIVTTATSDTDVAAALSGLSVAALPLELLSPHAAASIKVLLQLPLCRESLRTSIANPANKAAWTEFLTTPTPLQAVPADAIGSATPAGRAFSLLLLTKALRKDAFTDAARQFLRTFFDEDTSGKSLSASSPGFTTFFATSSLKLADVLPELSCSCPLLLVSTPGYDASGRVEELANVLGKTLNTVAMGSPEGYSEADRYISQCMKQGGWVLLKNIHLASKFLSDLEKRLHSEALEGKIHKSFQLLLSSERSAKIPAGLITSSVMVVLEPPPGVKASLIRTVGSIAPSSLPKYPNGLFPRLFFAAAWLHAVLTERMHYVPLGWSKRYEFSESDFRRVIGTMEAWVQRIRGERQNVPPAELPWPAMRRLVAETIYGGKIDNEFDDVLLDTFCSTTLSDSLFQDNSCLVKGDESMKVGNVGRTLEEIHAWIHGLPEEQPPQWLGLPASATSMVLSQRAQSSFESFARIQTVNDDDNAASHEGGNNTSFASPQRSLRMSMIKAPDASHQGGARWATKVSGRAQEWKQLLTPAKISKSDPRWNQKLDTAQDPITSALLRDWQHGQKLLHTILANVEELLQVCSGERKPNNTHRSLINAFLKEQVPASWNRYSVPSTMTLSAWVVDFAKRIHHIAGLFTEQGQRVASKSIAIGLLFFPGALLTASRQGAARHASVSLETLVLEMAVFDGTLAGSQGPASAGSLSLQGITLQSGGIRGSLCYALTDTSDNSSCTIPLVKLSWVSKPSAADTKNVLRVPLYLNNLRGEVLAVANLPTVDGTDIPSWLQRGVCLVAWNAA
ncbi:Hypothetical protein, putative [Bodo saltans]|uniref:AAA+ ATPase domain-containing protein n=1 Tax=Bodo saltans TaxID=75058 RepID=A0A0S4J9A8_BODSA|nr:Hypothetical protein, putative [Bodo saltans]|eukprot:CUG86718.1 Hypothetical protein, putative [Bodo saltans]